MRKTLKTSGLWLLLILSVLAIAACSGSSDGDDSGVPDADVEDGGDAGGDEGGERVLTFSGEMTVDNDLAGAYLAIAPTPDGQFAVAY